MNDVSQGPRNWVVYVTGIAAGQQVWLYNIEQQTSDPVTQGRFPALSPDGRYLAVWRDNRLIVLDLETLDEDELTQTPSPKNKDERVFQCCTVWAVGGKQLAYIVQFSTVTRNAQGEREERDELTIYDFESHESKVILSALKNKSKEHLQKATD